jgi:hypothetical protein
MTAAEAANLILNLLTAITPYLLFLALLWPACSRLVIIKACLEKITP